MRFKEYKLIHRIKYFIVKILNSKISLGHKVKIMGPVPFFKIPKNGRIVIGDEVNLNSSVKESNTTLTSTVKFVTGYDGRIVIGKNTDLNGTCIVAYDSVEIGKYCQIASGTLISDTDFHPVSPELRIKQMQGLSFNFSKVNKKPIKIGDNVWVGWGVTILKGVTIGDNSIIAAGAVVVNDVESNCIAAGNPAKKVKEI